MSVNKKEEERGIKRKEFFLLVKIRAARLPGFCFARKTRFDESFAVFIKFILIPAGNNLIIKIQ